MRGSLGRDQRVSIPGGEMNQDFANAYPRKNFFIQMFTKDIGLEDCILDLIDNSIDGLIRSRKIKLSALSKWVFAKDPKPSEHPIASE